MKNLTKHLLLLIIIFPLIILLSSILTDKASAATDCQDSGGTCINNKDHKCPAGYTPKKSTNECGYAFSPLICCIPNPPPPCGGENQFCCGGANGRCNPGLFCDGDGACSPIPISTLAPTPTPTPIEIQIAPPTATFKWRQIAVCLARTPTPPTPTPTSSPTPTPIRTPRPTDCTDSGGQCIKYNTCPIGQSSTRKTHQCGGELSSLICCISKPTPAPIAIAPTPTPTTQPPTPTPTPTQPAVAVTTPSVSCPLKSRGDANCDGKINIVDFNIWRDEFKKILATLTADFDGKDGINIVDFNIWRDGFKDPSLPH